MGTVTNPLQGLIDGLLQGHALATQMHRQQQQDQAFRTNQALHGQQMSMQDIMNDQLMRKTSLPVENGMVQDQLNAVAGPPSPVPGLPDEAGIPSQTYYRKAKGTVQTVNSQGVKQQWEPKSPERQQQEATALQASGASQLEEAKTKADIARARTIRQSELSLTPGGGIPAPEGLEAQGWQAGEKMTRAEYHDAIQGWIAQREKNQKIVPQGGTMVDSSDSIGMPGQPPPAGAGQPGNPTAAAPGGVRVIAQGAPKDLSEPEQLALSAVQRVAAAHGIPFDRTKNPQDPRAQIPTQFHNEVDAVIARSKVAPEVAEQLRISRENQAGAADDRKTNANNRRADQSYALNNRELDNMRKPVDQTVQKIGELQDMLNQNSPAADALVGPKLVSVLAGGLNSGLKVNEATIHRAVGGRSKWEDLKASFNKWQLNPKLALSITDEQRRQIRSLVQLAADKATAKQKALDDAGTDLIAYQDPTEHRKIVDKTRKALAGIDQGQQQAGTIRARDPQGQLHEAPAGSKLPAGWTLEK